MAIKRTRSETVVKRKTKDNLDQESNHSVQDIRVSELQDTRVQESIEKEPIIERLAKLKLPQVSSSEWKELDRDLDHILEASLKGPVKDKLKKLTSIVYKICKERCGTEEKVGKSSKQTGPSRRQKEVGSIRTELRQLRKAYLVASEAEKPGLTVLRDRLRSRLMTLRIAERLRKRRSEKRKTRGKFFKNPFNFVGDLLGKPKSGKLNCSKEEMDASVTATHEDSLQNVPLGDAPDIRTAPFPEQPFNVGEILLSEVKEVVRKARAASAPGPSGLTYKIYKNCPLLTIRLWKLIKVIWREGELPSGWLIAEGCFVPKEENSSALDQFREISTLNIEGKIFWSVVSKRLTKYLLDNKYIDTSVQKGGISGFAGCLEHTAAMSQLIIEAKQNKSDLSVVWLDLAKAYPSIPHQLI